MFYIFMKELHMGYSDIANLTFPQAYQLSQKLNTVFREQNRANESGKINQVLRQMRHGRK